MSAPMTPYKGAKRGVTAFFFGLGFAGANSLARIPTIREGLGLNDSQLGLLLLCSGIGAVIAFRTARLWARKKQSRHLATGATAVMGVLLFVPAWTSSPYVAGLSLTLSGYASGLLDISLNANGVLVERRLGRPILAALHGYCSLGSFSGAALGTMAATLGITPTVHLAVVGFSLAAISLYVGRYLIDDEPQPPSGDRSAVFTGPLVLLGAVAFCSSVGEGAMAQWTAIYLRDELNTTDGLASFGFAAYSAAMVTGRLLGDRLAGRWPAPLLLVRSGLLAAASLSLALLFDTPPAVIFFGMGVGAGLSMVIPAVFRSAVALPKVVPASALSAVATLSYGGFLFGPPSIGFIAQATSLRVALWLVVVLALALAGLGRKVGSQLRATAPAGPALPH